MRKNKGNNQSGNIAQLSESVSVIMLLTLSGGCMDAYSYLYRGGVFANAQTGNLLLLGVNLTKGQWHNAFQYACPVVAFAAGIAAAEIIRRKFVNRKHFHWRQMVVLIEAIMLFGIMFIPQRFNLIANSITSLACGAQVQSFRKLNGSGMATTMCIGNLRMATHSLCEYFFTHDKTALGQGMLFYGAIAVFVLGAVTGNIFIGLIGPYAIGISSILLIAALMFMIINREDRE